jgi:DNA polymerase-3 subunit delta
MDGDVLAADPGRLLDEIHTVPLFGGRRAIWVQAGTRPLVAAVEACLKGPQPEARLVIEAGDMRPNAPLRALCERDPRAAAIPCFADSGAALAQLVERELAAAGLGIDPDARTALLGLLGADRIATRHELAKLALYAHGTGRVRLADLEAVVGDGTESALDGLVDAAFSGDIDALERSRTGLAAAGTHPGVALSAALAHALRLYRARIACDQMGGVGANLDAAWPRLHFSRRRAVEAALGSWSVPRLGIAIERLGQAGAAARRSSAVATIVADEVLTAIVREARRRAGRGSGRG